MSLFSLENPEPLSVTIVPIGPEDGEILSILTVSGVGSGNKSRPVGRFFTRSQPVRMTAIANITQARYFIVVFLIASFAVKSAKF